MPSILKKKKNIINTLNSDYPFREAQVNMLCNLLVNVGIFI